MQRATRTSKPAKHSRDRCERFRQHDTPRRQQLRRGAAAARPATMGKNRRSTVFLRPDDDEEKEPTSYYHDLEATHDDRAEERRRIRLKQGKLLPRDPWGPGEFVSSCALQERPTPEKWAAPPNAPKASRSSSRKLLT